MSEKKKSNRILSGIALAIVFISVVVLVIVGCSQLFQERREVTSTGDVGSTLRAVVCTAAEPDSPFFTAEGATEGEHKIKITYKGEVAGELFYTYDSNYETEAAAEAAEARMHADYNIYMGEYASKFVTTFGVTGTGVKVTALAETEEIGADTGKIFFITQDDYARKNLGKVDDLVEILTGRGFQCEYDG